MPEGLVDLTSGIAVVGHENVVARAGLPGLEQRGVADDVVRDTVEPVRRRGIAGTVLIQKIAGAAAEAGSSLREIVKARNLAAVEQEQHLLWQFDAIRAPLSGQNTGAA